jgi:hypothetical protein
MSRVTAAFVCALDDPDNARPASIMCSNNCGRYVCSEHAVERKGPGSPMVCLVCAKALGVLPVASKVEAKPAEKIAPKVEPKAAPKIEPIETPVIPMAEPRKAVRSESAPIATGPKVEVKPIEPAARSDPGTTQAGLAFTPLSAEEAIIVGEMPAPIGPQGAVPVEEQKVAPNMIEPEAAPKSAASETIVSQRGNTLQVPKVTSTAPRTGQTGPMPKARLAQRTDEKANVGGLQNQAILWAIGAIVLGIIGFALIVAALQG